jgi:hypothetical protein
MLLDRTKFWKLSFSTALHSVRYSFQVHPQPALLHCSEKFSLQRLSHSYNSTVIAPPTVCISSGHVGSKAYLAAEAMLPEHVHYSTVTAYISLSDRHYSRLQINCFIPKKTVPHTNCTEEAFLSCGPQPEVL